MVLPALLGAAATIGGGILGANAQNQAAAYNYNMDLLNYYQRERERTESIRRAEEQERDVKLGTTDASGNKTHFIEGVGWVTDLSDDQRALQEAYQREEMAQFGDLDHKRNILESNVQRQGRENLQGDALFDAFQRIERGDSRDVENLMNQASVRGISTGYDELMQAFSQNALRTGASNSGKMLNELASGKARELERAFMDNKINAKGQAAQQYDAERGNMANLYNMFASRASAMPDVAYNPRNIDGMSSQMQGMNMQRDGQSQAALINAFAKKGGSMPRIALDTYMGAANAVTSGGNQLAAALGKAGAAGQRNNAFSQYEQYAKMDPSLYRSNSGVF